MYQSVEASSFLRPHLAREGGWGSQLEEFGRKSTASLMEGTNAASAIPTNQKTVLSTTDKINYFQNYVRK
jgi:hypothetical protein